MADLLPMTAGVFNGDNSVSLVTGDVAAAPAIRHSRFCWAFDDTQEEAILSQMFKMPVNNGTLSYDVLFFSASANSGTVNWEVWVEAVTPDSDTLDMENAESFDAANDAIETLSGTAGDPRVVTATVTNKDGVVAGDWARIGIRRDAADGTNDTATGDMYFYSGMLKDSS
ncbi:MAG: hypothetical protein ACYS5F_14585 [Planctomycetota bacterium]|jgi:hypothetical protein